MFRQNFRTMARSKSSYPAIVATTPPSLAATSEFFNSLLEQRVVELLPAHELAKAAKKLWPTAPDPQSQSETALQTMSAAENRILAAKLAQSPEEAATAVVAAANTMPPRRQRSLLSSASMRGHVRKL
jgi:hypothetical protein